MSSTGPEPRELAAAGLSIHADPGAARADDVRQLTGNLTIGARLLASATAFVFMSFLFAFFYLRAVNSNDLWRPKHVVPVQGWGVAVVVLTILSAVVFDAARRQVVGGTESNWRTGSLVALGLAILVIVAQGLEYATITFKTDQGGWAAVFWGWTLVQLLFWLGAVYWVETLVAQTLRRPPAAARQGTAGSELLRPSADACLVYLYTMAGITLISYVLLYLVK
jgi:heme/copper-type cytochrome/quinol oxidase subunit 3